MVKKVISCLAVVLMVNSQVKLDVITNGDTGLREYSDGGYDIIEEYEDIMYEDSEGYLQIYDEELPNLSTEDLLEIVTNYPRNYEFYFNDNFVSAMGDYSRTFNGTYELLSRNDFIEVLYEDYMLSDIPSECFATYTISMLEDGIHKEISVDSQRLAKRDFDICFNNYFEENFLSLNETFEELTSYERLGIIGKSRLLYEEKGKSEIYDNQEQSIFLDNTLDSENNMWSSMVSFYTGGSVGNINSGNPASIMSIPVSYTIYTPNNTAIQCTLNVGDVKLSNSEVNAFLNGKTGIILVDNGYKSNNCHAYAWARREDLYLNSYSTYISDGSYISTTNKNTGYKVVFGTHSGYVSSNHYLIPNEGYVVLIRSKYPGGPVVDWSEAHMKQDTGVTNPSYYKRSNIC